MERLIHCARLGDVSAHISQLAGERPVVWIADGTVVRLYPDFFPGDTVSLEAGEALKTPDRVVDLARVLAARKVPRSALAVIVGGGTLCDMAAFTTSVYRRGIAHIRVPTTHLAINDAAVGGKCGVNLDGVKNVIGLFAPAEAVLLCAAWTETETEDSFANGIVEALKTAAIADAALFCAIETAVLQKASRSDICGWTIPAVARLKSRLTELDPLEKGTRVFLNAGHTVGHALETASGGAIPHGRAVMAGLVAECAALEGGDTLSMRFLALGEALFGKAFMKDMPVPGAAMDDDKKICGERILWPVLRGIGQPEIREVHAAWLFDRIRRIFG